jgi:hypothetical protein
MQGGALAAGRAIPESDPSSWSDELVSTVCAGSGLICAEHDLLRQGAGDVVQRDPSVVTINDLQKDFFVESALVAGRKMTLDENLRDPAPRGSFLSSSAAKALPALKTANAQAIMRHLGVDSSTDVATAAYLCGSAALPGEARSCAASVDAVGAFVAAELGRNVNAYSTSGAPASAPVVKSPVTVLDVAKGSIEQGKKIVVCHHIAFPSTLFYCHRVTGTKVVQATLKPENESAIKAVGICHINTALWLSRHPAFKALHIAHGEEACHFLVQNDIVFTPATPKIVG